MDRYGQIWINAELLGCVVNSLPIWGSRKVGAALGQTQENK